MVHYIYWAIIILLLTLANYFLYLSFYLSLKSQRELDKLYVKPEISVSKSDLLNGSLISTDIAWLFNRICILALVLVLCSYYDTCCLNLDSFQFLLVLVLIFLNVSVAIIIDIYVSSRQQELNASGTANKSMCKLLLSTFKTFNPILPNTLKKFRIDEKSTEPAKKHEKSENMLKGILQFGNETVKDIMTSKLDIVDLDIHAPFSKVMQLISENSYSRVPVYSGSRDNIVGILYIKDLLPYLSKTEQFRWAHLIRPQLSVPETKKIDNLLREFQSRKIHLAVVIDEYGGVSGVVTMEDIIEEIVGEINDEYDEDSHSFVLVDANTYVFNAKTSLQEFCRVFNLEAGFFEDNGDDVDTLAGLLLDLIGDLPKKHQIVRFKQFKFEILVVDERHISKVKVTLESEHEQP